ncbi:MAG: hypothetical protein AUK50_10670 [Comamonadaceae bacterium CG2_30_57_122]|nr:MAG: hypothetical protein AUK50_10670 [Comamonadaceae bacterium CG2_30_57_122]
MLISAVNIGDLDVFPPGHVSSDDQIKVVVTTLIPWLHIHGYDVLADGLTLPPLGTTKAEITTSPGATANGVDAQSDVLSTFGKPEFPLTKSAMIAQHEHVWPTIAADLKAACDNGLSACKAGARKWREACALDWARANKENFNTIYFRWKLARTSELTQLHTPHGRLTSRCLS